MLKEDVAYAKKQYRQALADYNRKRNQICMIETKISTLESFIKKLQEEIAEYKTEIDEIAGTCRLLKFQYEQKYEHWKKLNTNWCLLANQNHNYSNNGGKK